MAHIINNKIINNGFILMNKVLSPVDMVIIFENLNKINKIVYEYVDISFLKSILYLVSH